MNVRTFLTNIEHGAEAVIADLKHEAESLVHQAEKELEMIPQPIQDLIDRIKAALAAHSDQGAADATTIASLTADKTALQGQLADCQALDAQKDGQIATLTQELADTQAALQALADATPTPVPAPAPAPAPADGSSSADPTP